MAHLASESHSPLIWLNGAVADRILVGGKGASLSVLTALGAPVPLACALMTSAWREFARTLGLPCNANSVSENDLPNIRTTIMTAPLPLEISSAISDGYEIFHCAMGNDLSLAVRSSAVAEDSAQFSFAGLHDTVLDVRTPAALEQAIRHCWASLWSDRAHTYRIANNLADDITEIAVVIQQLVRSDVSFVVFTTDPITDRTDHLVITATWGLGESIVSGLTIPDHIVVGQDGSILDYRIGDKHLMMIPGNGPDEGTRTVPVPRVLRSQPALSGDQVATVTTLARSLASRLGYEADLEGGLAGGSLYLFQARPITTITAQPSPAAMPLDQEHAVVPPVAVMTHIP